jgi:hypothetical protein
VSGWLLCQADARRLPLADESVDCVVTDPPAGIGFMGKAWDSDKGGRRQWVAWLTSALAECLRVAKPGSILLCWALPRTSHWTGTAIEDAGWLIEDRIAHHFGNGFPKHRSKLKPATEDWWLARKPGPKWLGVERSRVAANGDKLGGGAVPSTNGGWDRPYKHDPVAVAAVKARCATRAAEAEIAGRWPPNLVLSHAPDCDGECAPGCPIRLMGEQSGERGPTAPPGRPARAKAQGGRNGPRWNGVIDDAVSYPDSGTAARFFPNFEPEPFLYAAKASRRDRGEGNTHPTTKSTALMRWLCRLACPEGGVILDAFMGSGSTGCAAIAEGFDFVGIEIDPEWCGIARARIANARRLADRPCAPPIRPARDEPMPLFDGAAPC